MSSLLIAALIPFVLIFVLIVLLRWPALKAMPLTFVIALAISFALWKITPLTAIKSFTKGILMSAELLLILFGAIWLLLLIEKSGKIKIIQSLLVSISKDIRIQAIIIVWLFGALIEGVAGFGIPAALTAPLLVSLGFAPIAAIVTSLIANSTSVSFGAAGTPILIGLKNLSLDQEIIQTISQNVALFHLIGGLLIPLTIVFLITHIHKEKNKSPLRQFAATIPFAILSSLSFTVPYYIIAKFVGPELPAIGGGIIGLAIITIAAKNKFLVPKEIMSFPHHKTKSKFKKKKAVLAISPYLIIIAFLMITRLSSTMKYLAQIPRINITALQFTFLPTYTPSFYFVLTGIITILLFKIHKTETKESIKETFERLKKPTITLIFAIGLAQLFLATGSNTENIPSMPLVIAESAKNIGSNLFLFVSPLIGTLGSFITGSNTVSNVLFSGLQLETALALSIPIAIILALQVAGGAIGNMISIHNIIAASATVHVHDKEGEIIRKTIWVSIIYALIVGATAFLILNFT